jgi:hypothetical protein
MDFSTSDYTALNYWVIREKYIEQYLDGSGHGLIYGTFPEFD